MILHHWTLEDRCRSIAQDGWRATSYVAEEGMELGVWFCDQPDEWSIGNEVRLTIDFPDDQLRDDWRSKLEPDKWQIPTLHLVGIPLRIYALDGTEVPSQ